MSAKVIVTQVTLRNYELLNDHKSASNVYFNITAGGDYTSPISSVTKHDSKGTPLSWDDKFDLKAGDYEEHLLILVRNKNSVLADEDLGTIKIPLPHLWSHHEDGQWFKAEEGHSVEAQIKFTVEGSLPPPKPGKAPYVDLYAKHTGK